MAGQIQTDSAAIQAAGLRFNQASMETQGLHRTAQSLVGGLGGSWSGMAYARFQETVNTNLTQVQVAVQDLQDTANSLRDAAQAYELFEQQAAGAASRA